MKKLICIIMAVIMLAGCRQEAPRTYDFYNGFEPEMAVDIGLSDTEGYKNIATDENLPMLQDKVGLANLESHEIWTKKTAVVANFYFDTMAEPARIAAARQYAMETFWNGTVHTADMLPYEDWQYSHWIKNLVVQIFCEGQVVINDTYSFVQLTDSGKKQYDLTSTEDTGVVFDGSYIDISTLLAGTDEQLAAYMNIDSYAGMAAEIKLRQTQQTDRLFVEIHTTEKQIDPAQLSGIYTTINERFSFISRNICVQLFADGMMYYRYDKPVDME